MELVFEVRDSEQGGFHARALGHSIFTQADCWEELRANILEAMHLHFENAASRPRVVELRHLRDGSAPRISHLATSSDGGLRNWGKLSEFRASIDAAFTPQVDEQIAASLEGEE